MRTVSFLIVAAMVLIGLLFSALNDSEVIVDLYFAQFGASLGGALVAALVIGFVLAGALLWLLVIWPQQRQLANARRALASPRTSSRNDTADR